LPAGNTELAVTSGMLAEYDLHKRLTKENFAKPCELKGWIVEAGPKYYDETLEGVKQAVKKAEALAKKRGDETYSHRQH
jgi:hypothetical protein